MDLLSFYLVMVLNWLLIIVANNQLENLNLFVSIKVHIKVKLILYKKLIEMPKFNC
jgi:hypothetical protein